MLRAPEQTIIGHTDDEGDEKDEVHACVGEYKLVGGFPVFRVETKSEHGSLMITHAVEVSGENPTPSLQVNYLGWHLRKP